MKFNDLTELFNPGSIVLVGASDRPASIGKRTLDNIVQHSKFEGDLYLVNPRRDQIDGHQCFNSVADLPAGVSPAAAVIVIPGEEVITALNQCADRKIRFAIVLSSGFGEESAAGKLVEAEMRRIAVESGMRIYGPNCPGIVNIEHQLGLTFSPAFRDDLQYGPIAVATQGGALGRNLIQGSERGAGYTAWASSGNEADLQVADFIHFFADNPKVTGILSLLEGVNDGARFAQAALKTTSSGRGLGVLKVGRSEYGRKAAASHTASITGSADVNSAVLAHLGVAECDDVDELVDFGSLLARARPNGSEKIAVYGSSGGACALCADILGASGLELAEFTEQTLAALKARLPSYAAINNPVDTTAMTLADPEMIDDSLLAVCADPSVSLVVVPFALDYGEVTRKSAQRYASIQTRTKTPIIPIWQSERQGGGYQEFAKAGMVPMRSSRNAGKAIRRWIDYGRWYTHRRHDPTPALITHGLGALDGTLRTLSEPDGKSLLTQAGLQTPEAGTATTREQAVTLSQRIGYPVVLKVVSNEIAHKTDIGGVKLNLQTPAAVETAFDAIESNIQTACPDANFGGVLVEQMIDGNGLEVLLNISRDPVFGYILTMGLGGIHVELFRDVARCMLPVSAEMVTEKLNSLRCAPLFKGLRGSSGHDIPALVRSIVTLSDLVVSRGHQFEEIELNPVWVGAPGQGAFILDAVITERT
ncbi:MAG: acetate--CoA ligase family protein [Burkholderiaceae bacterium]